MPSPFPGMDPYLEGYLWPDVHHRLATQISDQLTPRLRPRYVARIELRVVADEGPEAEIGIMYPVPLRHPDPDVPLDLNYALQAIYERAAYDLSIDYSQPPPPPELTAGEAAFTAELLKREA